MSEMSEHIERASKRPPARVYDEDFVPALFGPWADPLLDHAGVTSGQALLDVACGTGALTVAAAERIAPRGSVIGLDANPEMLAVAREKPVSVEWIQGRAEALPFEDARFDRVVSQFAMMFFEDAPAALREMMRVLRPGGRLVVAVCDAIDHSPGYAVLTELLHRLFGPDVAQAFRAPFTLGDRDRLAALARDAALPDATISRHEGAVRFGSIADLVAAERACAWTLGGALDDAEFGRLVKASEESLAPFAQADGRLEFSMPALVLTADKP